MLHSQFGGLFLDRLVFVPFWLVEIDAMNWRYVFLWN